MHFHRPIYSLSDLINECWVDHFFGSCLIEAFLPKAALKKSANTSCSPRFWMELPKITSTLRRLSVVRSYLKTLWKITARHGTMRFVAANCSQNLPRDQCAAIIGLLIHGTFFFYNDDVFFPWLGLLWYRPISWIQTCYFTFLLWQSNKPCSITHCVHGRYHGLLMDQMQISIFFRNCARKVELLNIKFECYRI